MIALRRHSSCELLSISSTPLAAPTWFEGPEAEVSVVAAELPERAGALAVASMTRPRRAFDEEIWIQLFIDDTFVDLARAADDPSSEADPTVATFRGHVRVPALYFDGQEHRARVKFVKTVSRVVARDDHELPIVSEPEVTAEADFVATLGRPPR
ncbi:MAG: hypothetical protein JST00_25710 [Deltaproteobacteria bacterium]|nr:hypothetical protein [Deltaproteobacteria bacterium]